MRVPAIVVSPWVGARSVSNTLFDHTTIIKTILARFCPAELEQRSGADAFRHWLDEGHPHYMGKRVAAAADLGGLLTEQAPRPAPDREALVEWVAGRHAARTRRLLTTPAEMLRPAEQHQVTDLQAGLLAAAQELHRSGHPAGQP